MLLILCPMPVGPGNLAILQEALTAAQHGITVLLLAPAVATSSTNGQERTILGTPFAGDDVLQQTGIAHRDYTSGEGTRLVHDLLQAGAMVVESVSEAVDIAKKMYS
jgi:iron complex transport system ATP-binding protein